MYSLAPEACEDDCKKFARHLHGGRFSEVHHFYSNEFLELDPPRSMTLVSIVGGWMDLKAMVES